MKTNAFIQDFISKSFIPENFIIPGLILSALLITILVITLKYKITSRELTKKLNSKDELLKHAENKFITLFHNISDEVYLADFQGNFIEMNQSACNSLGYTREELLKMKFSDVKTKKYKQYVNENIKTILKKGSHTYETEHISKSGEIITYEMKSKLIDYEGRTLILTIARNISERIILEKKIVQTIIETEMKERKRFSSDLHDELGPVLSTIKLYSDLIKKGNFNKLSLDEAVKNIDELVEIAISTTKEISNNITPNVLDDFGLAVAINEFCSFITRTKSVNIDLDTKNYNITKKGIETTILYQTTKELINNTLKHAGAKNIRIQLKNVNNQIILYYRDDGIGFDVDKKIMDGGGLGLNNIINKIRTIKGNCDFNSKPGEGMFIVISVKVEGI
jgi:PAS domain S-box-containing protein